MYTTHIMPSRNLVKMYTKDTYYHIYNRGINKNLIFKDDDDYRVLLNLLKRYLSNEKVTDNKGREYEGLADDVELLAYCLMPNHFHLLVYQLQDQGTTKLLRRVMTAYVKYFNRKYQRLGPLFQSYFKASRIDNEAYLWHISRYIHLNPDQWHEYPYSSYGYYIGERHADWIRPGRILQLHQQSGSDYQEFIADYQDHKDSLEEIEHTLADF